MSILIKKCLLGKKKVDIYIEGNIISEIAENISSEAEYRIGATNLAAFPSFANAHTHAAMTLFRGYADDMPLMEWLQTKIWPNEAKLTEELVYHGSRLACLEMIKSGTTFFNDMYWHFKGTARAVKEMGLRASISAVFIDMFDKAKADEQIKLNKSLYSAFKDYDSKIQFALGPHAIYTVSEESLLWARDFSDKHNVKLHIHLSESEKEVKDCLKRYGVRPVEYLDKIGFLCNRVIACHAVWLSKKEVEILAKRNVSVVHNPVSNMKLAVNNVFPYELCRMHGLNICLGTDGAASNNNLSMFDTMKAAALIQKHHTNNPTALPAKECVKLATLNGFKCFDINAGALEEGKTADLILIDLRKPELAPAHNLVSNVVYAANAGCVDTTICNGRILMQGGKFKGQERIIGEAKKAAAELVAK
jgi:5-methylthioadenosine/S-adenosylhomocysteine deaminase